MVVAVETPGYRCREEVVADVSNVEFCQGRRRPGGACSDCALMVPETASSATASATASRLAWPDCVAPASPAASPGFISALPPGRGFDYFISGFDGGLAHRHGLLPRPRAAILRLAALFL